MRECITVRDATMYVPCLAIGKPPGSRGLGLTEAFGSIAAIS
jgi:hypothetical protein